MIVRPTADADLEAITAIYADMEKLQFNVKRFRLETQTMNTKFQFIKEGAENYLDSVTTHPDPVVMVKSGRGAQARSTKVKISSFVEVMGWKAVGNKLADYTKSTEFEWVHKPEVIDPQGELF